MTTKQLKALQALLTEPTKAQAAKKAGINESTLRRYLSEPAFKKAYRDEFSRLVEDASRQAQKALSPAIEVLRDIAQNTNENSNARIAAARGLLEYGLRMTELTDIIKRIEAIEEAER